MAKHRTQPNSPNPEELTKAVRREVKRSDTFLSMYGNEVQIQTSPWDVRLVFGELGDMSLGADSPTMNVKQVGEVRMSIPLDKKLSEILSQQLTAYESKFGSVPVPPIDG